MESELTPVMPQRVSRSLPRNRYLPICLALLMILVERVPAEVLDGDVVQWGCSGNITNIIDFQLPAGLTNVVAVSSGGSHNLALTKDGTVVSWGSTANTPPAGLSHAISIAAGNNHSLALKSDGTVMAWGEGAVPGAIDVPAGLSNVIAISARVHSLALRADGTVAAWGGRGYGPPENLSKVLAIAAGGISTSDFSVALKDDGRVIAWGIDRLGGETDVPPGLSNVVAIAAGGAHGLALKNDSTVVGWGYNADGQATPPPGLSNVAAIAAGNFHSLALKSDGAVVAWGSQTDVPSDLGNAVAVSAGTCNLSIRADLKITSIDWTNQHPVIRFHTFSDRQYSAEYSTDPGANNWLPLPGVIGGDGRMAELIDPDAAGDEERFYRLVEWPK